MKRFSASLPALLIASGVTVAIAQETKPGATVAPAPVPQPVKGQVMQQREGTMLGTELIGANVRVGDQDKAGTVTDVVISPDGKVTAVVLGVGGFLGLGARNVAINLEDVRIANEGRKPTVHVTASKHDLEKAPPFKTLAEIQAEKDAETARQQRPASPTATPPGSTSTTK